MATKKRIPLSERRRGEALAPKGKIAQSWVFEIEMKSHSEMTGQLLFSEKIEKIISVDEALEELKSYPLRVVISVKNNPKRFFKGARASHQRKYFKIEAVEQYLKEREVK